MAANDLTDHVLEEHGYELLGDLFPALLTVGADPFPLHQLDVRSRNCLTATGLGTTWGTMLGISAENLLDVRNFGMLSLRRTLGFMARRTAALDSAPSPRTTTGEQGVLPARPLWLDGALADLAAWAVADRDARTLGGVLDAIADQPALPDDVAGLVAEFRATELTALPLPPSVEGIREQLDRLVAALGDRVRPILFQRIVAPAEPATLDNLGKALGVTRERVRQLEHRLIGTLAELVSSPENRPVRWAAGRVRRALGAVVPADDWWRRTGIQEPTTEDQQRLLLWLAGPYRLRGGWLLYSGTDIVAATTKVLDELLEHGPVPMEQALTAITVLSVQPELARRWIAGQRDVRESSGMLVRWRGTVLDKAVAVLTLQGEAMGKAGLVEAIGEGHSVASFANVAASDRRIRRVGKDRYGLATWGGYEYRNVVEAIADEVSARGGEAAIADLVAVLPARFDITPSSVVGYASSHRFVKVRRGVIRLRGPDDPEPSHTARPPHLTKNCYRAGGGWRTRLLVTREQLRGSGSVLRESFACALAVTAGASRTFHGRLADATISRTGLQPTLSSVKAVLEHFDGREGDLLFIEVVGERCTWALIPRDALDEATGWRRLALEVGAEPGLPPRWAVAAAVGLPAGATTAQIAERFDARGETRLAALARAEAGAE